MSAVLIISIFLLAAASYIIFRSKRSSSHEGTNKVLMPPRPRSLFEPHHDVADALTLSDAKKESEAASERAAELRRRALLGDKAALHDAHASGEAKLYQETLDALVAHAGDSAEAIGAIASYITEGDQLRANPGLAEAMTRGWGAAPDLASTGRMLHIAALSARRGSIRLRTAFQSARSTPQVRRKSLSSSRGVLVHTSDAFRRVTASVETKASEMSRSSK